MAGRGPFEEPEEPAEPPARRPSSSSSSSASESITRARTTGTSLPEVEKPRTNLSRTPSRPYDTQLERLNTTLSRVRSRRTVPQFSHVLSHRPTTADVIVDYDGPDDPYRPRNWNVRQKVVTTALYGLTTMGATFASSVYSPGVGQIAEDFNVGTEVSSLGISLLLFGFGVGPLLWAPLSEVYGRKIAVLIPYFISAIFAVGTATAKDIQTVCITRFFAGFFGSAPVTNTGGVLNDLFSPDQRGIAMVGYAMAVVGGPTLGPIVGGAVVQTPYLRWRWTEYLTMIFMMTILVVDIIFIDESSDAILLQRKAQRLRFETGNWALHAKHEEWDVSLRELANKYLIRPFQLLMTPICFLVALYASFVYGILYANLSAFPIVFEEHRGWGQLVGALPFLAILIGIVIGGSANAFNQKYYLKKYHQNNDRAVPEARLPPMMAGSVIFACGLFIFAWTGDPQNAPWIAPCIGAALIGMGFFTIFQSALNYLVDTFTIYAASAVAANTFLRSCLAGAFPLFMTPLLHNVGVGWGISIFGFIAVALIPIPYLFFIFGERLRARGEWSRASVTK